MNALTTTPTNACPARYRSLSPERECAIRGLRYGTEEKPGGKPPSPGDKDGTWDAPTTIARRAAILAALANGPLRNIEIAAAIGAGQGSSHQLLVAMAAMGLVVSDGKGKPLWRLL